MIKHTTLVILIVITSWFTSCDRNKNTADRSIHDFNQNWLFAKDLPNGDYSGTSINDSIFELVDIPHTANIEPLIPNNQWQGTSWYRNWFEIPEAQKNRKHFLYFEGAMQNAEIYLNGKLLSQHLGGYLPFIIDISDNLNFSKRNLLAVKIINTNDSLVPPGKALNKLDFNMYGGIYRPVKLITTSKLYITDALQAQNSEISGIFVQFDSISSNYSLINVKAQIRNDFDSKQEFTIQHTVLDSTNKVVTTIISKKLHLESLNDLNTNFKIGIDNPILWSPSRPYLYQLKTEVLQDNIVIDSKNTSFGIRKVELTLEGLLLNGEKIFIRGTNRHQEYPFIGYALSDEAQWRDAVKIKNAGFDMVRLSHYPHSEAFMNACDALGIITMNCIPGWQYNGNEEFKENLLANCRDLIRRDRNHPSVFFWELSLNESWMENAFMDRILKVKDEEMDGQKALTSCWIDYEGYDLFIPARQHGNPPYYWNNYKDGKRPVFIAEYGDWEYYAQNAGFNQTNYHDLVGEERTSRQLRGFGEKRLLQQALNYQEATNSNRKGQSTIGHANWLMFDYNRGYANDIEASGIADIFRIPKFAHFFYQSQRDANELVAIPSSNKPMVYIASYWEPESSKDIKVFSNCNKVKLTLNERIIAIQTPDQDSFSTHLSHPPFTFRLEGFESGKLEAVGYIDGKQAASFSVITPEKIDHIQLEVDESGIAISKNDVVFVYASLVDKNSTLCPINNELIEFSIQGEGILIGENPVVVEAGIATILLKTGFNSGEVIITANSATLESKSIKIQY